MERMAGVRRLIALQSMFNFDAAQRMGYRFRPLHFHECNCVRVSARQGVSISFSCVYKLFFFLSVSSSRSLLVTTYLHSFSLPTLPLQLPLPIFIVVQTASCSFMCTSMCRLNCDICLLFVHVQLTEASLSDEKGPTPLVAGLLDILLLKPRVLLQACGTYAKERDRVRDNTFFSTQFQHKGQRTVQVIFGGATSFAVSVEYLSMLRILYSRSRVVTNICFTPDALRCLYRYSLHVQAGARGS